MGKRVGETEGEKKKKGVRDLEEKENNNNNSSSSSSSSSSNIINISNKNNMQYKYITKLSGSTIVRIRLRKSTRLLVYETKYIFTKYYPYEVYRRSLTYEPEESSSLACLMESLSNALAFSVPHIHDLGGAMSGLSGCPIFTISAANVEAFASWALVRRKSSIFFAFWKSILWKR